MFIKTCILPELFERFYTQKPSIATVGETADEEVSGSGSENLEATNSKNSENDNNTTNGAVNATDDNRSSSTVTVALL